MKTRWLAGLLTLLVAAGFSLPVYAHVLRTDGSIGAVLHIDPNDDPIAGQPATLIFEFKDTQGKFQPGRCTCQLSITNGAGQQVLGQALTFPPGQQVAVNQFTFPTRDVYAVTAVGQPQTPNDFQPFTLTYSVRVARGTGAPATGFASIPTWLLVVFAASAGLFFGILARGFNSKVSSKERS